MARDRNRAGSRLYCHGDRMRDLVFFLWCWTAIIILWIIAAEIFKPPFVLGSERNGDGTIEYLCLGRGCEEL